MSRMLYISEAAILAIHSMLFIAENRDNTLSTKEIAAFYNVSEAHLSKVLQRLTKAGMLKSVRGPKGGFVLEMNPEDITLLELYELFDGTLEISNCFLKSHVCGRINCLLGDHLTDMNIRAHNFMGNTKLSDALKQTEGFEKNDKRHNQN